MSKIFVVTMLTEIDYLKGGNGYDHRTVGWFGSLKEAENDLKVNCGDVHEGNFDYAVIEEVTSGFYSGAYAIKHWYEWVNELGGFKNIKEPAQWFGITAIGIG